MKISGALDSDPTASAACGRTPRSRPDRTAIAARSNRNREEVCRGIVAGRFEGDRRRVITTIDARSRSDRGVIVAEIAAKIVAKVNRN